MRTIRQLHPYPERRPTLEGPLWAATRQSTGQLLIDHITQDTRVIVEIGSWLGHSVLEMCKKSRTAIIYCIDTWLGGMMAVTQQDWTAEMPDHLYELFLKNTWDERERIVPIRQDSVTGLNILRMYAVDPDLIYVDGGHEFQSVRSDLELSIEFFPRATIICDDYDYHGVMEAVESIPMSLRPGFQAFKGCCVLRKP